MPNSLENANIEEVLSSIRRLVSDDFSRKTAVRGGGDGAGRLVLTPALRVAGGTDEDNAVEKEPLEPLVLGPLDSAATWEETTLEDRIAKLEAAVSVAGGDWEPDGSEEIDTVQAEEPTGRLHLTSPILPVAAQQGDLDLIDQDLEWLQDLITNTLRQELKGEMGERISRNLRKMVRREISRALADRDFS